MKILFVTIIALVIPLFFIFVFVLGTYNRLATLRNRCRHAVAAIDVLRRRRDQQISSVAEEQALQEDLASALKTCNDAVTQYNTARRSFPASLVAGVFHFAAEPFAGEDTTTLQAAKGPPV